jgi:hypothetical protein
MAHVKTVQRRRIQDIGMELHKIKKAPFGRGFCDRERIRTSDRPDLGVGMRYPLRSLWRLSIYFLDFLRFISISLAKASLFDGKGSVWKMVQSFALDVNPLWFERCFLSLSSGSSPVWPT